MTKDQWFKLAVSDWERFDKEVNFPLQPSEWAKNRLIILQHIKNLDELTKIYEEESDERN
jgi:hypothetical protein